MLSALVMDNYGIHKHPNARAWLGPPPFQVAVVTIAILAPMQRIERQRFNHAIKADIEGKKRECVATWRPGDFRNVS